MKKIKTTGKNLMNCYAIINSPIGGLMLVADDSALTGLYFAGYDHIPVASNRWTLNAQHPVLQEAAKELREYLAGKRKHFSLPLRLAGTDFQQRVWREISLIPYGETISYSDLASRAGGPQAIRAVGTNTGRNPVSIIIPCHRMVGKNGTMRGFAGGLERKRRLLELENFIRPLSFLILSVDLTRGTWKRKLQAGLQIRSNFLSAEIGGLWSNSWKS